MPTVKHGALAKFWVENSCHLAENIGFTIKEAWNGFFFK